MSGHFLNRLDDLVREELAHLGYDYRDVVSSIEESRASDGAVIRFHPPYEDLDIETPEPGVAEDVFVARVRRRLRVVLEAPERSPAGEE
ncbi:MAG: hypothetical protein ACYC7A_03245 [Thermoanaerobaculia bacterium]